jgi:putative hydrolase of HD superfamily
METLVQHNEADISTWLPLEYKLNLEYGEEAVSFSSYMKELRNEICNDSLKKME